MPGDDRHADTHQTLIERLHALRAAAEETIRSLEDSGRPVALDQTLQGRLSRIDAIGQQQMARAGSAHLRAEIGRIDAAILRHAHGRYGLCCRCEEDIDPRRLEADPAAPFCVPCQQALAEERRLQERGR